MKGNLKLVHSAKEDEALKEVCHEFLKLSFHAHVPQTLMDKFDKVLAASSYADLISTSASQRLMKAADDGVAYHLAWVELTSICHAIIHDTTPSA